jgi:ornithine carbamoyltransferase
MNVRIAFPDNYQPLPEIVQKATAIAGDRAQVVTTTDAIAAVKNAHVIYTDVWASMGQEDSAESRIPLFQPYQVNEALMAHADPAAIVLHCLPAHRGEEITNDVMEGAQSRLWDQAENRMHAQQALISSLLGVE